MSELQTGTKELSARLYLEYISVHKRKLVIAVICMIIAASATAANAWIMQPILDDIFLNKNEDILLLIPIIVLAIAFAKAFASYGQAVIMKIIGQRVIADMQLALYQHLLLADIFMFTKQNSGHLISRFSNDINIIRKHLSNVLSGAIKEGITLVFLVGIMFYQSWELALIAFGAFPIAIYPIIRLGKRMRKVSEGTQSELGQYTSRLDDTFQGIKIVKAYNQEAYEVDRARSVIERIYRLYVKAMRIESAASPIMELLAGAAIAAVIWYGGKQVLDGITTPGAFFSFIAALIMAYKPMKSISGLNTNLQEALAAIKRFYDIMDKQPVITDGDTELPDGAKSITFDKISFSYSKERTALRGLSLEVPEGKTVALVGPSGAGKSTIMQLILRFYDPDSGAVQINGQDISSVKLSSLRDSIAVVNQEVTLFDDTVRANIAYGRPDADIKQITEAARNAAAHDFISELPEGYDTMVGQHGVRLSGGQRQRIAIARAMLKDAPILLLDEATSSLDTTSEKQVQEALKNLMHGRTTVVIAHRLSTINNADNIYVIKNGEVVETGTHKDLINLEGEYSLLYKQQFAHENEVA